MVWLAVAAIAVGTGQRALAGDEPTAELGATLVTEFEANEVRAERKWLGKPAKLVLQLQSVNRDKDGKALAYLVGGIVRLGQFYCAVTDDQAAALEPKQLFLVTGSFERFVDPKLANLPIRVPPSFRAKRCEIVRADAAVVQLLCKPFEGKRRMETPSECAAQEKR